jgi:hypothetical protein
MLGRGHLQPLRARVGNGELAGFPDRIEHGIVGALVEPENLRRIECALKHRPVLVRPEGGGDENQHGIGRQARLEPVDHRVEMVTRRTGVGKHFRDLDLPRPHRGRLWRVDQIVIDTLLPVRRSLRARA